MSQTLGLRAAARALGIAHVTLLNHWRNGHVPREADGKFNVEAVRAALRKDADPLHVSKIVDPEAFAEQQGQQDAEHGNLTLVRIAREKVKLRLDKKTLAERELETVSVDDVRRTWSAGVEAVKGRAMLLPAKVAPRLIGRDVVEIHMILDGAIRELLTGLAEYRPNAT